MANLLNIVNKLFRPEFFFMGTLDIFIWYKTVYSSLLVILIIDTQKVRERTTFSIVMVFFLHMTCHICYYTKYRIFYQVY